MGVTINTLDRASLDLLQRALKEVNDLRREVAELRQKVNSFRKREHEGKLTSALAKGGTATFDIYEGEGVNWGATADADITVKWPSGVGPTSIASGKWLRVVYINGEWRPASGEC